MSEPTPPAEVPATPEGQGDGTPARKELALYRLALKGRWDVNPTMRHNALVRVNQVLSDPQAGYRAHLAAAKVLIAADLLDLKGVEVAIKAHEQEEVVKRVEALEQRQGGTVDGAGEHQGEA